MENILDQAILATPVATSESKYRLLVENIFDYAIYMLDPYGIITSWNAGARRLKGYLDCEIIGNNFSAFYTRGG